MRKIFITALGAFVLALMFSFNFQNNDLVENSAFADGTCCCETDSICKIDREINHDYYHKPNGGSCKDTSITELTLAP